MQLGTVVPNSAFSTYPAHTPNTRHNHRIHCKYTAIGPCYTYKRQLNLKISILNRKKTRVWREIVIFRLKLNELSTQSRSNRSWPVVLHFQSFASSLAELALQTFSGLVARLQKPVIAHILPISFVLFLPLSLRHVCSTNLLKCSVLYFRMRFYFAKTKLCKCKTTGQLPLLRDCVDNSLNFNRNITISLQTRVFFLFKMLIFTFNWRLYV